MDWILRQIIFHPPTCKYNIYTPYYYNVKGDHDIPCRFYNINAEYTLLMCHGTADDIGYINVEKIGKLYDVNVCVFDYAGYGLHSNKMCSEQSCYLDVIEIFNFLTTEHHIDPEKIILLGHSLGSAVACYLAHYVEQLNRRLAGLILISGFMSINKIVTDCWLPFDKFTSYKIAPSINCPVLAFHGISDLIIPFESGYDLSQLFPYLYNFVALNCGHEGYYKYNDYHDNMIDFISLIKND